MKIAVVLALAAALLSGCQQPAAQSRPVEPKPPMQAARGPETPRSPDACAAAGGRWEAGGLRREPMCFQDYPDAGRPCDGPAQCQGLCIEVEGRGRCQTSYPLFGCFRFLNPQGERMGLCVD